MTLESGFIDPKSNPFEVFGHWFRSAEASELEMPNAMTLATVDSKGYPNARVVLLKGWDQRGFRFFTNYQSQKGRELQNNPKAAAVFWWEPIHRQIRIRGEVHQTTEEESDDYFESRNRHSQIGAWASNQSTVLDSRDALEAAISEVRQRFDGVPVPRPSHWGGFRLVPFEIEFWQERPFRLHDRMVFRLSDGEWLSSRLSP